MTTRQDNETPFRQVYKYNPPQEIRLTVKDTRERANPIVKHCKGRQYSLIKWLSVRVDLSGHLKYSQRWSGVCVGVLLGAQGAVRRGER